MGQPTSSPLGKFAVLAVVFVVAAAPVYTIGASATPGVQNPTDLPDDQLFEGSDDGQIEVWERATYPLRTNDTGAATQVEQPGTFQGQTLGSGESFSAGDDGSDSRDLVATFGTERNPTGVHDSGTIDISFENSRAAESSDLVGQENVSFIAANVSSRDDGFPDDYSEAVTLFSNVDNANENASFRMLAENKTLTGGEYDLASDFGPGYHIVYATVRQDDRAGFQVDSDGNVSVDGDVAIVGVETVSVHRNETRVFVSEKHDPGASIDFTLDTKGAFSTDDDGSVTHTIAVYDKSTFEDSRVDLVIDESELGPDFSLTDDSQLEHSIEDVSGVADVEDGIEINGEDLSDGRVARTVGLGAIIDRFTEDLGADAPVTDSILGGGASNSETEDINASVTAVSGRERITTISVETDSNFSTGTYQYVVYSQLDSDETVFSTGAGTIEIGETEEGGPSPGPGGGGGGGGGGGAIAPPDEEEESTEPVQIQRTDIEGGQVATIEISEASANETVQLQTSVSALDRAIVVESVDVQFQEAVTNATLQVSGTSVPPAGAPGEGQLGEEIGYIETTLQDANDSAIAQSTFTFEIDEGRLASANVSTENVRLFRVIDGTPVGLPTDQLDGTRFRSTTPGFSVFVVGTQPADISIASGQLASTSVDVGESFTTSVQVRNDGGESGAITVRLGAGGETVASQTVTVGAGEEVQVDLGASIDEAGTYEIAVNGNQVGTLTVEGATPTPVTEQTTQTPIPAQDTPTAEAVTTPTPTPPGDGGPGAVSIIGLIVILVVAAVFLTGIGYVAYRRLQ